MIKRANKYNGSKNVPDGWAVRELGDLLVKLSNGLTYDTSETVGLPVTRIETISSGVIDLSRVGHVSCDRDIDHYRMEKGDLLFSHINSLLQIGKVAYYDSDGVLYHGMNLLLLRCDKSICSKYLYYLLMTPYMKCALRSIAKPAVNQASISMSDLKRVNVILPNLCEQEKIVNCIGLWDLAIEKQTALIEKLRLRKRALMQQLLTGKKRLPGFTDKWKTVKLGEVCKLLHNVTLSREQLNYHGGDIQNVHYGDVLIKYPSILDAECIALPYINSGVVVGSNADFLQDGDIIMSDTAEDETVGKACEIVNVNSRRILAGLHTMVIRPSAGRFAPCFLGYYINSEAYHKQLIPLIQGIKVCSLGKQAVQNTVLAIPSFEEQVKIVEILALCDAEIQSALKKKKVFQSQKRGLMQQLLTGKKRIK